MTLLLPFSKDDEIRPLVAQKKNGKPQNGKSVK
jgi:hypothetical protein